MTIITTMAMATRMGRCIVMTSTTMTMMSMITTITMTTITTITAPSRTIEPIATTICAPPSSM